MGSFFLFILIIFLLIVGIIGLFILKFVRIFIKGPRSASAFGNPFENRQSQSSQSRENSHNNQYNPNHEKIFSKDEGEYIDYEEIK